MTRRNVVRSLIGVILSAFVAVFAMLCVIDAFGWFAISHAVTGSGMNIQAKDYGALQIRASSDGADISVSEVKAEMKKLPHKSKSEKFIPSAFGQFSFWVHDGSADRQQPCSFLYSISVKNNEFCTDKGFPNGIYSGISTESDDFKRAEQYINSHIMFFEKKDENGYSEWIRPGVPTKPTEPVIENDGAYPVTVYWVWVDQYDNIFTENSGLIKEETRKEIEEYYSKEENIEKLLVNGEQSVEAYNMADTLIGMIYKYVCFQIEVTKS